jgi:hypothetical protein
VRYDLVARIFRHVEGFRYSSDCMSSIRISCYVLLIRCAPVYRRGGSLPRIHSEHRSRASYIHIAAFDYMSAWGLLATASVPEMWFQAVIRPRLNSNSHTSRLAQFRKPIYQLGNLDVWKAYLTASSTSSLVCPLKALCNPAMNLCR